MLKFIVLGLVPGTHLQLSFEWLIILAAGLLCSSYLGVVLFLHWKRADPSHRLPNARDLLRSFDHGLSRLISLLHRTLAHRV